MRIDVGVVVCALLSLTGCSRDRDPEMPSDRTAGFAGAGPVAGTSGRTAGVGGAERVAGAAGFAGSAGTSGGGAGAAGGAGGADATGAAGGASGAGGTSGMSGSASSATTAGATAPAGGGAAVPGGTAAFPPVMDFAARGPFTGTTMSDVGPDENYTVYRPAELGRGGVKHPIVGWMSGGGTDPSWYALLPHLATHGFIVVASNTVPLIGDEATLGKEIIAGIDWAIAENGRASSVFEGKLDTTKIAAVGYSMGSLATFTIAMDRRLTTTVHISGGNMARERVGNLRAPAAFICGTPGDDFCDLLATSCDIAGANCAMDFERATTPVFYATFPNGHLGIMTAPFEQRIAGMTTEWLRLHLMRDTTRKTSFVGGACGYCTNPDWNVKQKNLQ